ncbi:Hypothetical_protein [Hexamita inflata]|uniref:Hypothetical_protein n=2 Tax=Hexamita inflata TaxID=28002 RepID=A0ABP1HPR8_9EUKA
MGQLNIQHLQLQKQITMLSLLPSYGRFSDQPLMPSMLPMKVEVKHFSAVSACAGSSLHYFAPVLSVAAAPFAYVCYAGICLNFLSVFIYGIVHRGLQEDVLNQVLKLIVLLFEQFKVLSVMFQCLVILVKSIQLQGGGG